MSLYCLYTDGGARGNPGPAGAGAVITDQTGQVIKTGKKYLGRLTNNEAEYQALLFGLQLLKGVIGQNKTRQTETAVYLDSELVVKQLNGQYQIKEDNLVPLFVKVWNKRVKDFPKLTICHIDRAQNSQADKLANQAMDEGSH